MLGFVSAFAAHSTRLNRFARLVLVAGAVALTGCSTMYIDGATKQVSAAAFKKPAEAKPVQLLFEFQTKGTLNTRATDMLKAQVVDQVTASGLFSRIVEAPMAGSTLLSVTLNNVPLTEDAAAKGALTGATFGIVGSIVSDGYVCTLQYTAPNRTPLVKVARHALHTKIGSGAAPPNAIAAEGPKVAVETMTRQVVSTALLDLSQDVNFK